MVPKLAMAALLLGTSAPAQVLVVPQATTVVAGRTRAFQIRMAYNFGLTQPPALGLGPGFSPYPETRHWTWSILDGVGTMDEVAGLYTAPGVTRPATVTVLATYRPDPRITAQAKLLVLPHEPFDLVEKVLGPAWLTPLSEDLPFWNAARGLRNGAGQAVEALRPRWRMAAAEHLGGCGIPFTLRWTPPPGTEAQALTLGEGEAMTQCQLSGQDTLELATTEPLRHFTVESLQRSTAAPGRWLTHSQSPLIDLRGLFPWAGNPGVDPGHQDGRGHAARFRHPFGLEVVATFSLDEPSDWACLVSDPVSHVIRRVSPSGRVTTPWGTPGQAGHQDVAPSSLLDTFWNAFNACRGEAVRRSLFNRPTFLSVCPAPPSDLAPPCRVADSGNHVIRLLREDGTTTTLAGVPGQAGHRDGPDRCSALFNDPRGLAEDPEGNVYIADRGNHVIRRLTPSGQVSTLAGSPGQAGSTDGEGTQARFQDLQGLAVFPMEVWPWGLYAVDGHAIRHISLPDGRVTTVLGVVATPGFRNVTQASMAERSVALLTPCLRDPCGLTATRNGLLIADQGNHAVRAWAVQHGQLSTLAGDPGHGETRWGLVRDGLEVPLDERFAALEAPRTVVAARDSGCYLVTSGPCLAELRIARRGRDRLQPVLLTCAKAQQHQACIARFAVGARNPSGGSSIRRVHYTVDFLEADGTLAERRRGTGVTEGPVSVEGTFTQKGTGQVVVRCVTDQGMAAGARVMVPVE